MKKLLAAIVIVFTITSPTWAADFRVTKDLRCTVALPFGNQSAATWSMTPVLLRFTNDGPERRVTVELTGGSADVQGEFVLPGQAESRHWLYVPMVGSYTNLDRVRIVDAESGSTLKTQQISLGVNVAGAGYGSYGGGSSSGEAILLDVSGLSFDTEVWEPNPLAKVTTTPEEMPDDWRAYTGLHAVVITQAHWASPRMPRGALTDWAAMGGLLIIVDASDQQQATLRAELAKTVPFYEPNRAVSGGRSGDKRRESVGRGAIAFVRRGELRARSFLSGAVGQPVESVPRNTVDASQLKLTLSKLPPFGITLFFLIIFSALIGPVGWWYVVGKRKQALVYYVLAPCVSICFVVIVVSLDFLKQGVTPRTACIATEFIDHRVQKRVTTSKFTVFCPFTLGNRLAGATGELPLFLGGGTEEYDHYSGMHRSSRSMDSTHVSVQRDGDAVLYRGSVLPARTETHFAFAGIRQERRRLDVQLEGNDIVVENHLGMDLHELVILHEGSYAMVDTLANGARATARSVTKSQALQQMSSRRSRTRHSEDLLTLWNAGFDGRIQRNAYSALRNNDWDGLIWLDSKKMQEDHSSAAVFGVY